MTDPRAPLGPLDPPGPPDPLDVLIRQIAERPEDENLRMALMARLAFLDVMVPADEDRTARPEMIETPSGRFLLAHRDETALAGDGPRLVSWLPLRRLGALLDEHAIGVVIDPHSEHPHVLTTGELSWLAALQEMGAVRPIEGAPRVETGADDHTPATTLPPAFFHALDAALAPFAGHLAGAWLGVRPGAEGAVLWLVGMPEGFIPQLMERLCIAAAFLPEGWALELGLADAPPAGDAGLVRLPLGDGRAPKPPGTDPDAPPILR